MKDLQQAIGTWHVETFGPIRSGYLLAKLREEFEEFMAAPSPEEAADIVICLMALMHRAGFDLQTAIEEKFEIVRSRDQKKRDEERGLFTTPVDAPAASGQELRPQAPAITYETDH